MKKLLLAVLALILITGGVWWFGGLTLFPWERLPEDPGEYVGIDLINSDLRWLNLRWQGNTLRTKADFDTNTRWPMRMAWSYDPQKVLEEAKNPGLGIRTLHQMGITGKGVPMAFIDQDLLCQHAEYGDRIRHYEEIDPWGKPQVHGVVASIGAGATVGVAPEAEIYYFVIRMDHDRRARNIAQALARILEINESLPPQERIRTVSISASWRPGDAGYEEAHQMALKARDQGVLVVSSVMEEYYPLAYQGLGRMPGQDPDDPKSYTAGAWWASEVEKWYPSDTRVLFPMDSITTASWYDPQGYVFWRVAGWSWVSPYIAGLYALALQVNPELTPEEFGRLSLETAYREEIGPIINPVGLLEQVEYPQVFDPTITLPERRLNTT